MTRTIQRAIPALAGAAVALLLGVSAAAGPLPLQSAGVVGKVMFAGKPLPGARVSAYREAEGGFRGEPLASSAPAAADGSYEIALAPGSYYLVARLTATPSPEDPGGEFFGYFGANPVPVQAGPPATRNIQVVRRAAVTVAGDAPANVALVAGKVVGPDGPVAGASVHVYADAARQFRGPDIFGPQGAVVGGTGEHGEFSVELPPGSYFLVGTRRAAGDVLGPLQPGDFYGWFDGNPVAAAAGTRTEVTIQVVGKLREAAPAGVPAGETAIRGRIHDPDGKVPPGIYAFATTDPNYMIGAMPPYRSLPVGPDGSFSIAVPAAGTYYVSARSGYGGPPLPGEWHGFHGGGTATPVRVEAGRATDGVDVVVRKME